MYSVCVVYSLSFLDSSVDQEHLPRPDEPSENAETRRLIKCAIILGYSCHSTTIWGGELRGSIESQVES